MKKIDIQKIKLKKRHKMAIGLLLIPVVLYFGGDFIAQTFFGYSSLERAFMGDPFERFPNESFAGAVLFPEEGSGGRAILLDGDDLSPEAREWLEKFLGR